MATRYRFGDGEYPHFITFAVVNWIDALSRPLYKDIIIESLKYCQSEKGLIVNGWIIMSNHVHLIARCQENAVLPDVRILSRMIPAVALTTAIPDLADRG